MCTHQWPPIRTGGHQHIGRGTNLDTDRSKYRTVTRHTEDGIGNTALDFEGPPACHL